MTAIKVLYRGPTVNYNLESEFHLRDGILLDASDDLFRHLIQEDFFVLLERVAFVGFASRAEEVAVFTSQSQLPFLRPLFLAFTNLDT